MPILPEHIMVILSAFVPVFSDRVWDWAQRLGVGAILAPKQRTVSAILRVLGLSQDQQYQNYHRVLNRAQWSGLQVSRILLGLLVAAFVPVGETIVLSADETLERRRGAKIAGIGCFRDAARSSRRNKVKSYGLRWVSMALLARVPWSGRRWALPFLTVLAPSAQLADGQRHKSSIDWIGQMVKQVSRWLPGRQIVLVVDGALAARKLARQCAACRLPATLVTRLPSNARLFDLPGPRRPGQRGRVASIGQRQPKLDQWLSDRHAPWQRCVVSWYNGQQRTVEVLSQVALWHTYGEPPVLGRWVIVRDPAGKFLPCRLFATDPTASPAQIVAWYVMRWSHEVTFEEVRAHLGFETQRQWNAWAVARSSPALLGLFSLVTLLAQHRLAAAELPVRSTAWYTKSSATFSDVLAFVRRDLWATLVFPKAATSPDFVEIPSPLLDIWIDTLSFAT